MARNGRGGTRELPPGAVSATRTDLNRRQPITVTPSPVYGASTANADAQRTMPLPNSNQLPPVPPTGAPPTAPAPAPPPPTPLPPGLTDPSRRPTEPVTHGISAGPGAGPEALGLDTSANLASMLRQAAMTSGSPSLAALADQAARFGQ